MNTFQLQLIFRDFLALPVIVILFYICKYHWAELNKFIYCEHFIVIKTHNIVKTTTVDSHQAW